jgi:hypothetical protein
MTELTLEALRSELATALEPIRSELASIRAEIETIKVQISGLPLMAATLHESLTTSPGYARIRVREQRRRRHHRVPQVDPGAVGCTVIARLDAHAGQNRRGAGRYATLRNPSSCRRVVLVPGCGGSAIPRWPANGREHDLCRF